MGPQGVCQAIPENHPYDISDIFKKRDMDFFTGVMHTRQQGRR